MEAAVNVYIRQREAEVRALVVGFDLPRDELEREFRGQVEAAIRKGRRLVSEAVPESRPRPTVLNRNTKGPTLQQRRVASMLLDPAGRTAAQIYREAVDRGWIPKARVSPAKRGRSLVQPMVGRGWVVQSQEREGKDDEFVYRLTMVGRKLFTATPPELAKRVPAQLALDSSDDDKRKAP